jgi:hypothetical protein
VSKAAALPSQDAVIGVGSRVLGGGGSKGGTLLHALQNEIDTVLMAVLHATQRELEIVFFPYSGLRPFQGEALVAGEGLDPALVIVGPPRQHLFGDFRHSDYLAEEVDHLLGPGQSRQITVDDKAIKTVIHKQQQASKNACENLHRSPPCLV